MLLDANDLETVNREVTLSKQEVAFLSLVFIEKFIKTIFFETGIYKPII